MTVNCFVQFIRFKLVWVHPWVWASVQEAPVSITASLEKWLNGKHVAEWSLGIIESQSQIRRLFDKTIQFSMALSVLAVLMTYFQHLLGFRSRWSHFVKLNLKPAQQLNCDKWNPQCFGMFNYFESYLLFLVLLSFCCEIRLTS